jgi:hypothetical protein
VNARVATAALLALAAGLAAGCGSDDEQGEPIPADTAQVLQSRLDEVQRRFEFGGGACADIVNDSQPAVNDAIAAMPEDVAADVRDALQQGFDRLFELSAQQCEVDTGAETEPQTTEEPEPTETTETVPPPETETETTETVPPPETETIPTEPPGPPTDVPDGTGGGAPGPGPG